MATTPRFSVDWDDLRDLERDLETADDRLRRDAEVMEHAAARVVAERSSARAPRLTGRLASSITARGDTVTVGVPYGRVIQQGWPGHGIEPQPYFFEEADEALVLAAFGERVEETFWRAGFR